MAALTEGRVFSAISHEADFLAVSELPDDDDIIISCRKKTVNVVKVSNQKTECSWSVRHGITLTSPVLWDSFNERFITVANSQEVKSWDKETKDFEKAKKKQSTTRIHAALVLEGKEPVLLYSNGSVSFLGNIKADHGSGCLSASATIVWCAAYILHTTPAVLFVTKSEDTVTLYRQTYNDDTGMWSCTHETVTAQAQTLVSCDGHQNDNMAEVFFLWSEGMLSCVSVTPDSISPSTYEQRVPGAHRSSSIVVVDKSHVAVARVTKDGQEGICIHNTKFNMQQAWHALPEKTNSLLKVFCVRGQLFVPCGHTLYTFDVTCQPSTMVSVMAQSLNVEGSNPQPALGHVVWKNNQKNICLPEEETMVQLFAEATDSKRNYKSFKDVFKNIRSRITDTGKSSHWLMSSHMTKVVERIAGETKFWARDELSQLIAMQGIPTSCQTCVMDALIRHSEVELVHQLIGKSLHLPERCLTAALDFYMQCDSEQIQSALQGCDYGDEELQSNCPISTQLAYLLDGVLACPFSDVFLLESLRKVSFLNAVKLLEYLGHKLELLTTTPISEEGKHKGPSQIQVVDWMCLVIDAHMTQFVLSPDCHMALVKLHTVVAEQVQFYDCLIGLEALLEKLKARTTVQQDRQVGQYCIEVLHVF